MSGGHFDYRQYELLTIAEAIQEVLEDSHGYSEATVQRFKEAIDALHIAEVYAQRIDWLVSCDDGEEDFHRRLERELASLKEVVVV